MNVADDKQNVIEKSNKGLKSSYKNVEEIVLKKDNILSHDAEFEAIEMCTKH
jgi:hypothetical protein